MKTSLLMFSLVLLSFCSVFGQTYPANFSQVEVASGISGPTAMAIAPDGRIFVAQQNGVLYVIKNGVKLTTPALQMSVNSAGERGLIGLALHPAFATNGIIYLYYTLPDGSRNRVSRFWVRNDVIDRSREEIILDLDPLSSATNHNGGAMQFRGDKLLIAVGDNANGLNATDLTTYHGKILRINANGSTPGDNPFYSSSNLKTRKIWAYGLRNPFTFDVQATTGRTFVNDVGQVSFEEINDATFGGLHFGWPDREGYTNDPSFESPVYAYGHGSGDGVGCAITGGTFFNPGSSNYPSEYHGKYFFQDLCNNWINYIDISSGAIRHAFATGLPGGALGIDVGTDGNLYFLSRAAGKLYKIVYNNGSPGWFSADVGTVFIPGNFRIENETFSIQASGADIWGNSDQFHFVYQPIEENADLRVRVTGLFDTKHSWVKAGVMVRESLASGARNVMLAITRGNGITLQHRAVANGTTTAELSPGVVPYWLRIQRNGETISTQKSTDGVSWVSVGTKTLNVSGTLYIGLAFTSHSPNTLSTATMTNVTLIESSAAASMAARNEGGSEMNANLEVYPNPLKGHQLYVASTEDGDWDKVQLINAMGQIVMEKSAQGRSCELDVTGLARGVYFVRVSSDGRIIQKTLLKN